MRLLSFLFISLALSSVAAQDPFCVKYAKILTGKATPSGADEFNLINAVVGRVVVGCDDNAATRYGIAGVNGTIPFGAYSPVACNKDPAKPTNGITVVKGLVADPLNAPFFAGTAPNYNSATDLQQLNTAAGIALNPSIRFVNVNGTTVTANPATTGTKTAEGLVLHLVSFFGRDLGCSSYTTAQSTNANFSFVGRFNGNDNMALVHKNMNITKAVWNEFITTFANTLLSFGVTQDDITNTVVPYVSKFLLQPAGGAAGFENKQICNQPSCDCVPGYTNTNGVCVQTTSPPTTPGKNQASMITMNPIVAIATIGLLLIASLL